MKQGTAWTWGNRSNTGTIAGCSLHPCLELGESGTLGPRVLLPPLTACGSKETPDRSLCGPGMSLPLPFVGIHEATNLATRKSFRTHGGLWKGPPSDKGSNLLSRAARTVKTDFSCTANIITVGESLNNCPPKWRQREGFLFLLLPLLF